MNDNKDNVVDIKTDELREAVPAHTIGALDRYIEHKYEPGGFLTAVLQNKLMEAVGRADVTNKAALPAICAYVYNRLPVGSWGSEEAVDAWLRN